MKGAPRARYEGEGAVLLEALGEAGREAACPYPLAFYEGGRGTLL